MIKKLLLVGSLLFVSCSDKEDKNIVFENEDSKYEYCIKHIDSDLCSFYRPFILISAKLFTVSNPCNDKVLKNTKTCDTYIYSTSFKSDLKNNIDYCVSNSSNKECIFVLNLLKEMKEYKDSFYE